MNTTKTENYMLLVHTVSNQSRRYKGMVRRVTEKRNEGNWKDTRRKRRWSEGGK